MLLSPLKKILKKTSNENLKEQQKQVEKNEEEEKRDIKNQVESVIDDSFELNDKGYSLDILTLTTGGYAINAQIPFEVETEASELLLSELLDKIQNMKLENVKEISIYALCNSQIVNIITFPEDEKVKKEVIDKANETKDSREAIRRKEWISSQFSSWDGSHKVLTDLIKKSLNDEKSYKHIETNYIDISTEEQLKKVNDIFKQSGYDVTAEIGDLVITTQFSAKNAFNATIKKTAIGIVTKNNQTVTLLGIE